VSAGLTQLILSLALMTVIKNLGRHSLPPLRGMSSRDSNLQEKGKWFLDRGVTHRVKQVWLPLKNQVLAVSALSCSEVMILMLAIWAIMSVMPRCLQLWHKRGGNSPRLEICCWAFLIRRSLFLFFFLFNIVAREGVLPTGS
jgi:hypothetical protein